MRTAIRMVLAALVISGASWGATYEVRNAKNAGSSSLRWAIERANARGGADRIVFANWMKGRRIYLTGQLPDLLDNRTTLDADIDDDGAPDIRLDGERSGANYGLHIQGNRCTIIGLAITGFYDNGIRLSSAHHTTIRNCHIGVSLDGKRPDPNQFSQVVLDASNYNTIGGNWWQHRNVIHGGGDGSNGIVVQNSSNNVIAGNNIGLNRRGTEKLGGIDQTGISITAVASGTCRENLIGGTTPAERNLICGVEWGIRLTGASENIISGNYFGLARDGETIRAIGDKCVYVTGDANGNVIGGKTAGSRNVFTGSYGVVIALGGADGTKIQGNYFGTNAPGTEQRRLYTGVWIHDAPNAQLIGAGTTRSGNYFTAKGTAAGCGVKFEYGGDASVVRHNRFGILPSGRDARSGLRDGVYSEGVYSQIRKNEFARCERGVYVDESGNPEIYGNVFRRCDHGVMISSPGKCRLGNLMNLRTTDDGGNTFRPSNTFHIYNYSPYNIVAQGNDFGTTERSKINAKIWDWRDDRSVGRVKFSPLAGGVTPTTTGVWLTDATAVPTKAGGAEVVFALSAPADVTVSVLNITGRPIATVARDLASPAGVRRFAWNGVTAASTHTPAGTYLVVVVARDAEGRQARAITPLCLAR